MNKFLLSLILICLSIGLQAKEVPPRPQPARLVNDEVGLLNAAEKQNLERKLVQYNESTSTQIAVVIERSLEGDDVVDYAVRLAQAWGIGQEDKDNGVLIYVSVQDRKMGIATGYGTEGFLTDAISTRIRNEILRPAFQSQQYYQGLDKATNTIIQVAKGEYTNDNPRPKKRSSNTGIPFGLIIFVIILMLIIFSYMGRGNDDDDDDGGYYRGGRYDDRRERRRSSGGGGWFFFPTGGFGGGGGSGGDFGGGDDGGFGGFGGGDFGGGGSFGDW